MDLSGHKGFTIEARPVDVQEPVGESLLAAGWAAIASARAESFDVHLSSGPVISGALAVRIEGALAEVSVVRGHWTHVFAVADVALVRIIPRGGRWGR